ncbi:transmembrane protein UsgS [Arthroderma uncinatum]|uniref:transmembrane protein UsgS n=1 Tax=Arthroderma uncinatum TaxID=74035 RepID=UPI00144A68BB|nr:transmembrane protein UsgS [Arthroderma uncinatum]KAF3479933.1 transmembrane protein UsgS [Arthroderma uncinatum]
MPKFEPNAILRGAQLTLVGAHRALQNPELFKTEHYRQAALAVCTGIAIRLVVAIPIVAVKLVIWILSWVVDLEGALWADKLAGSLDFISKYVLQVPFFLMTLMRYITPTLDNMFMESLRWVDKTYVQKHKLEDPTTLRPMYYDNLRMYSTKGGGGSSKGSKSKLSPLKAFAIRYGKRTGMAMAVYVLSLLPVVGRFVLPCASFYTFNKAVGPGPAVVVFGSGLVLPKRYLIMFLQSYFSSRSLMRELLEPYFSRVKFTPDQKRRWFLDREGVLFGFAVGFYIMLRIPILGVLLYGIAEASTAYLVTKITDPPPPPAYSEGFAEGQVTWTNKHLFLRLPLEALDLPNVKASEGKKISEVNTTGSEVNELNEPGRRFS